jgi:oligopeptide/dipeptide ABC transporter ATP-binding protein
MSAAEGMSAVVAADGELLQVKDLVKHFAVTQGTFSRVRAWVKAVDGVSFSIRPGETLGLVGETACGKTTVARMVLRLLQPTSGKIHFDGHDVLSLSSEELRNLRRQMQIIFQDPYSSLDPRMTVRDIVGEPLLIHKVGSKAQYMEQVCETLKMVGLSGYHMSRYPHEFSGGQRQRISIARALILRPKLIVCDEPVSALDVSIQSQILNLLHDLQDEFNLTYLFIAHNLGVVRYISDHVAVMYLGRLMEMAPVRDLYSSPQHPYTQALLSAIPIPNPELHRERILLEGDVPSPINPPPGCRFSTRCRFAQSQCREVEPEWRQVGTSGFVACHLV